jgi:hypothetical protein
MNTIPETLEEKAEQAVLSHGRYAEMAAADKNARALTRKFIDDMPIASGKKGLDTMMTLGAMSEERWLPSAQLDPQRAKASAARKKKNRSRSKQVSASRRKNRR